MICTARSNLSGIMLFLISFISTSSNHTVIPNVTISGNDTITSPDTFQYTCTVVSSPVADISWYFNGTETSQLAGLNVTVTTTEYTTLRTTQESFLTIPVTDSSFGGSYECRACNIVGSGSDTRNLTVLGE